MKEVPSGNGLHRAFPYIERARYDAQMVIDQILRAPIWSYSDDIHYRSRLRWLSHGERNADMVMLYIVEYGLPRNIHSRESLADINLALDLHDIGKSEVPNPLIWDKSHEQLLESDREIMKTHVQLAQPVFEKFELWTGRELPAIVYDVSQFHHEKLDGTGKPHGLVEGEIGFFARLSTCIDQIVSRCEERLYHTRVYTLREAFEEVTSKAGKEFDDDILRKLEIILTTNAHVQIPGMAWLGAWE